MVVISAAYFWHLSTVKVAVNEAVTQIEAQASRESFKLKEHALNAQIELQKQFDNIRKDKDVKIKDLNNRVSVLTASLSSRPNRPPSIGSVSDNTRVEESKAGATGVQLYRTDAVLLSWFSGQTAELQVELNACYKQYNKVEEILNKFKLENTPNLR